MKKLFFSATILVATLTMILGMQSCTTPIDKTKLEGYWVLTQLNGEDAKEAFKGPIPTLEFNFADSTIAGSGSCNRYFGKFFIDAENKLVTPPLASTMKMCIHANKEGDFLKALGDTATMSVENGVLTFTKNNKVSLQFVQGEKEVAQKEMQPVTMENLAGKWNLVSIGEVNVSEMFKDKTPFVEISAEGAVTGNAGCNNFRSKVDITNNNTLTFGPAISTKMACPNMDGETLFLSFLSNPIEATIDGDALSFSQGGSIVLVFTKSK
ncbi:META domain-containing protein [Dysgonomonas sp. 25]|uniref:META domain-containing protein n=1 Tax=Dysgonomonas sp. 25 TaxID=2302933 RepID=UPI0013D1E1B2|nr:META domain-containing protein [Dysgonomonas sp. 25]NDV68103.1 META domain-containing protein [Dysgonomonas sp. 25]